MTAQHVTGPLEGVRVIEVGTLIAGPLTGRLLADFGAEVIKIEAPEKGDPMREWGVHKFEGRGLWWPVQSRNKKLITLNLNAKAGQDLLRRLVAHADVLIENFRPGRLEGWGLAPDTLLQLNPRLVIGRVSGYGQTGPYADRPGFAATGEALGGLRYINGDEHSPVPPRLGVSLGDSLAALFAMLGILMALYRRETGDGRGQVVDASILESCFAMLDSIVPEYAKLGVVRGPLGSKVGSSAPSGTYRCRDGRWLIIAANTDRLFERLCSAMQMPELLADPRFASDEGRRQNAAALDGIIGMWAARFDSTDLERLLTRFDVVASPIYSIADIFRDAHFQSREMLLRFVADGIGEVVMPGVVPKLSRTPGAVRFAGRWEMGADNHDVYCGLLGLESDELKRLQDQHVV